MTTPATPDAIVLKGVTYVKQDGRWVAPMPGFISTATFVDAQEALDHIATLTTQLAAANADGAMLADSVEDFIGAQGTAYEADQYLMLQGVLREYHARTGAR